MSHLQFESYYRNNFEALSSFALKLARNKMDADDLLQETAIKAYKNFGHFAEGSNFKNWTFTILKNTFISKYRRRKKLNLVSKPIEDMEYAVVKDEPIVSKSKYNLKDLSNSIETLSDKSKEPFIMYINGYQYNEISESLDIPIGTVKSRIHFARTKLRKLLGRKNAA